MYGETVSCQMRTCRSLSAWVVVRPPCSTSAQNVVLYRLFICASGGRTSVTVRRLLVGQPLRRLTVDLSPPQVISDFFL